MRLWLYLREVAWLAVFAVLAILGALLCAVLGAELLAVVLAIVAIALSILATGG